MAYLLGCNGNNETHLVRNSDSISTDLFFDVENSSLGVSPEISDYTVVIDNCDSGFISNLGGESKNVRLYSGDTNCIAKLLQFEINGNLFKPRSDFPFDEYLEGDEAIFASEDGKEKKLVKVAKQLSNPIKKTDKIGYSISELTSDQSIDIMGLVQRGYGDASTLGSKLDFNLRFARIIETLPSLGSFSIVLTFECNSKLSRPNKVNVVACNDIPVRSIKYLIVEDSFDNVLCTNDDIFPCDDLFRGEPTGIDMRKDYIRPGEEGVRNGGFRTKVDLKNALKTPDNTADHPNMLVLLGVSTGRRSTYRYYNLDVDLSYQRDQ